MLRKEITFEDFNGKTCTEEFFFHISTAQLAKWALAHEAGDDIRAFLINAIETEDKKTILNLFDEIIELSVGRMSADGRRFEQTNEIKNDFMQSGAYEVFFLQVLTDTKFSIDFINGVMPKNLKKLAEEQTAAEAPTPERHPESYTVEELMEMDHTSFMQLYNQLPKGSKPRPFLVANYNRNN